MPLGPAESDGKRAAFVNTGLTVVGKACKHPEEAFEFVYWMANYDSGMYNVKVNGGIPNGRPDVWEDSFLMADPKHALYATYYRQNPHVLKTPANLRTREMDAAYWAEWQLILLGEKTPEEGLEAAREAAQAVLDKPRLGT